MDRPISDFREVNARDALSTVFDDERNAARQYQRGLETGQNAIEFHIAVNDVWSTTNRTRFGDGHSSTFSYERLGYHANTGAFLCGVYASGCTIILHRYDRDTDTITDHILQRRFFDTAETALEWYRSADNVELWHNLRTKKWLVCTEQHQPSHHAGWRLSKHTAAFYAKQNTVTY